MLLKRRIAGLVAVDSVIVLMSIYIGHFILAPYSGLIKFPIVASSIVLLISHHLLASHYRLYQRAWSYASVGELLAITKVVSFSIIITAMSQAFFIQNVFIRTLFITWMLHMLLIGGSRFSWRLYRDTYIKKRNDQKETLIIGAGAGGTMVARQLLHNSEAELNPVAFIDDNVRIHGLEIMGIRVFGGRDKIEKIVNKKQIEQIIIAIPSLKKGQLHDIFNECAKTKAKTQIIPMLEDLMTGKLSISQVRDVEVEDLLGRDQVELDTDTIGKKLTAKTILVTGAGGSIGSEICRQICKFNPGTIILLGHGENSIYDIEMELKRAYKVIKIETEIADVQDRKKIFSIMKKYCPDVVYHAAAHKHVPLMERNPEEAVKNNVIGTKNVAEATSEANVGIFVMVSSDKAVNPTSVMGATKRIAEMVVQHMDMVSETRFVAVRFGNVLGSRGSVIPLFKKQIAEGGPVTVTDPEMVRYFMTIPEASRLVLQAGALAKGGEIFVLDMGEPVRIVDLAKNLIKLSGYTADEIPIEFTGMRPGEKMYEELLGAEEVHAEQVYPKIYVGKTPSVDIGVAHRVIRDLDVLTKEELRVELLDVANFRKVGKLVSN